MKKQSFYCPIVAVNYRRGAVVAAAALGLLAYYFILVDPKAVLNRTIFYAFQSRDINRALRLLDGWPIFFGPEMTGGGNLPGPFYYILLIPGLLASADWRGAWYQMMLLASISAVLGWFFFRRRNLPLAGLLFVTLIPLSVITQHYMTLFINPSYLYVALVPTLLLICEAFAPSRSGRDRGRAFVLASLIISLGIQIHYSIVFLFFAMLFMRAFRRPLSLPEISARYFWLGIAAFALPFGPYLVWMLASMLGRPIGQPAVYVGDVADVWPTMLHLLNAIFEFDAAAAIRRMIIQIINNTPVTLVVVGLSLWASRFLKGHVPADFCNEDQDTRKRGRDLLKPIAVCAAFGFIPFSYVFIVPIANRYSLPMVVPLIFIAAVAQESLLNSKLKLYSFNLIAGAIALVASIYLVVEELPFADPIRILLPVFAGFMAVLLVYIRRDNLPTAKIAGFTLTALLAALHLQIYRTGALRSNENNMVRYDQWMTVWSHVYHKTGWPLEELKGRVYFVNAHTNGDPEPTYRTVMRRQGPRPRAEDTPDGYILIVKPPVGSEDVKDWLLNEPIAEDLKQGLRNGDIELSEELREQIWSVAYRVRKDSHLPRRFHNWGLYYNTSEHAPLLAAQAENSAAQLSQNKFFFKWNECPDSHPYCSSAAQVEVDRVNGREVTVRVNVIGEALSQNSPWIHPTWTQAWNDPYVELKCGNVSQTLKLASSIGYKREYLVFEPVTLYFIGNNSILAPFERTFSVACSGKISEISVGRASSSVDQVRGSLTLPGQKLSLKL